MKITSHAFCQGDFGTLMVLAGGHSLLTLRIAVGHMGESGLLGV